MTQPFHHLYHTVPGSIFTLQWSSVSSAATCRCSLTTWSPEFNRAINAISSRPGTVSIAVSYGSCESTPAALKVGVQLCLSCVREMLNIVMRTFQLLCRSFSLRLSLCCSLRAIGGLLPPTLTASHLLLQLLVSHCTLSLVLPLCIFDTEVHYFEFVYTLLVENVATYYIYRV